MVSARKRLCKYHHHQYYYHTTPLPRLFKEDSIIDVEKESLLTSGYMFSYEFLAGQIDDTYPVAYSGTSSGMYQL